MSDVTPREEQAPAAGPRERRTFINRSSLGLLELIRHPIWVFDIQLHKIWWANPAALRFWQADSLEELLSRSFATDSDTVRRRLRLVVDHADTANPVQESWTLYPRGEPVTALLAMTPIRIDQERRDAVLIEVNATASVAEDGDGRRFLEATRYTSVMISYFRLDGQLISMNPAAAEIYGGLPGRMQADPSDGERSDRPGFARRFAQAGSGERLLGQCRQGSEISGDFEMRTGVGARWHHVESRLARDPMTGEQTILLIEEDVSRQRDALVALERLNRTLEQQVADRTAAMRDALETAENANRTKSEFLARMSHDLRTPLNAILGFSDVLASEHTRELSLQRFQEYGHLIHKAAGTLLALVDDLLDLSRIEAGRYPIALQPVKLAPAIDRVVELLQQSFDEESVALIVRTSEDVAVWSDPRALGLILNNLLSNALKFTHAGGEVRVTAELDEPGGSARLQITDTGIGISEDEIERIFDPYDRGRADVAQDTPGTGLGLAICRRLADLLHGQLSMVSEPGAGTTVTLVLPTQQAGAATDPETEVVTAS